MAKSYKLKDGNYIDDKSVIHSKDGKHESVYEALEGTVLYNNSTGSGTSITLSESAENFDYIEIFFARHGSYDTFSSVKVFEPHNKMLDLSINHTSNPETMQLIGGRVQITGTSLTREATSLIAITNLEITSHISYSDLYIYKVIGYK